MKKLIFLFVIMTVTLFSQGWNDVVQTTIPFSYASKVDLTTNRDGNHILVTYAAHPTYYLRYYLVNSSGSVVRNYTFENQDVQFANIDGTDDRIYVVYKLGNQIKTRKSTDAGQSWYTNIPDINLGNNTCNNVDIFFGKDDNALHVVWATQDAGSDYKTYYRRLDNNTWGTTENVTDGNNVGGFPTVSKSENRVHVSYNTGQSADPSTNTGEAKSRDKFTNTWQTPQMIYTPQSFRERIHAGSSQLFDFYYKLETGMGQYHADLYVKVRDYGSTSWSSAQLLQQFAGVKEIVSATNSTDGKTHIVYEIDDGVGYRNYNGSSWSSEQPIGDGYISPRIYSVSNDLYVFWGKWDWSFDVGYLLYHQYDSAPLAPQNVTVTSNSNNNPVISWAANNEADFNCYRVYKKLTTDSGTQTTYTTTTSTTYTDYDFEITSPRLATDQIEYWVVAVDVNNHLSPESSHIIKTGESLIQWKKSFELFASETPTNYELQQNYPNPFNPTTEIRFGLPEASHVKITIYNSLGKEVDVIADEAMAAGYYNLKWNASNHASGIYFYELQTNKFHQTKKMILMK